MTKALVVAKWEFLEKVRSKAFLISLFIMPVVIVLFGILPGLLATRPDSEAIVLGIQDESAFVFSALEKKTAEKYKLPGGNPNYVLRNLGIGPSTRDAALKMIADGRIEGYLYVPATIKDSGKVEYRAKNVGNFRIIERFSRCLEEIVFEQRAAEKNIDTALVKKLIASVDVKTIKVNDKGEEKESGFMETFFSAYIYIMMLMFMVITSGQLLVRSFVEEKSNRVIEILLSSTTPNELMIGKILGLSALGLLQVFLWGAMALAISAKTGSHLMLAEGALISLIYFVLGFLMYTAILIGIGSPVTTEQEAQQLTSYVSLILVFPIVLAMPAMQNPDQLWLKILTYIPLFTPAFMLLRIPIQMPSMLEIGITTGLLVLMNIFCIWAAAKIFRVAILMYGKRPTPKEIFKLLRAKT